MSQSPEDGIWDLANKSKRFEALLNSESEIRLDLMRLIIRAIHLCCSSEGVTQHADQILRLVIKTNFLHLHLSSFINQIPFFSELDSAFQTQLEDVISQLAEIFLELLQRFGSETVAAIPLAQLNDTLAELKNKNPLLKVDMLSQKVVRVKELKDEIIRRKLKAARKQDESELIPPENFRDISVAPQAADLNIHCKPFLRVNVVDGSYKDLEHYLDVQFRLLREDFILPLRDGIRQLQKNYERLGESYTRRTKFANDVHVYRNVTVLYPVCNGKGMVYRIRFDSLHRSVSHVKWGKTKRLKFGSLLCLSADDFYNLLFGTVENRDPKELCLGELEVRFEGDNLDRLNQSITMKEKFEMVESPAFFEAYRHVLDGLKEIQPGNLPFEEHIVKCVQDVRPPDYERISNGFFVMSDIAGFDLNSQSCDNDGIPFVIDESEPEDDSMNVDSVTIDNSDISSVSTVDSDSSEDLLPLGAVNIYDLPLGRDDLGFNESQMRAFQVALTKKIAVIQGPPGTGKTYVGQKIARVLLQSASLWQDKGKRRSPILMVSYTNHALDEFLGGLPLEGVVRVGGRCSEKLKSCALKSRRDDARKKKEIPAKIARARFKARDDLRALLDDGLLERSTAVLKCSRRGVLSFRVLKHFMFRHHVRWFENEAHRSTDDLLLDWLGVKIVVPRDSREKNDRNGAHKEDFRMQVSVRNFANDDDYENDDSEAVSNHSKVDICRADETNKPAGLCRDLLRDDVMSKVEEEQIRGNLGRLSLRRRWNLYRLWLQRVEKHHLDQLQKKQPDYERALARQHEVTNAEDKHILRNARVIGMTTTCAARYRRILQRICPQIVLVEEAAEVLEAHIITALTKGCQHLILIGDHQQLRPTPEVWKLAKTYKLDVSLFERMVNVGIPCQKLSVQHRMRPEIAALMRHIYDDLENHKSVEEYENIKGIKKNMFFIKHSHFEDHDNNESHSHTNQHEATFLVSLCNYLLQQGYSAEQITILTSYTGQMFAIRDRRDEKNEELKDVRLTTVDNFQGEENDIILLSLVRSNKEEKVGFIKIVNRACVALSRAKRGFYCIGNFDLLSKHSDIWRKIVEDLESTGSIGNALPLVCQIHGDEVTAETAQDFGDKVPYGGCLKPCEVRLDCGHACKKLCHPYDPEHEEYICKEECSKVIRGCSHQCSKLCYQECETDCAVMVMKRHSHCGHFTRVACGKDFSTIQCKERCEKTLSRCGHRCQARCGQPCSTRCNELVKRNDWPCGHEVNMACSATPADCNIECGAKLQCGHRCSGKCGECRMGRVHKRCTSHCRRVLVCSHDCKAHCSNSCPPCSEKCDNRCKHSHCNKECGEPCVSCKNKCSWKCRHHKCTKLCGELCDRPRCNKPCNKSLTCGRKQDPHRCRGLCGEPCICAVCEKNDGTDPITEIFLGGEDDEDALFIQLPDCKHIFAVTDLDRYMDMSNDDSLESHVIQLKSCPRCKSAIRTSLRYGNVIKQQLYDIEEVKKKVKGHQSEVDDAKKRLETRLTELKKTFDGENEMKEWERLSRFVMRLSNRIKAAVTENQVNLMERYCVMSQKLKCNLLSEPTCRKDSIDCRLEGLFVQGELDCMKKRSMSERVTQQELQDIDLEFTRLHLQLELCLLNHDVLTHHPALDTSSTDVMREVRDHLSSGKLIEAKRLDELLDKLSAIREAHPCLGPVTPEQKRQIVTAVGLSKGHWYKCPNGHCYAIGECGGAMEKSTCPECGAVIGGVSHTLQEGNRLAPEMDGAQHSAWSEQANLQNYVILNEV